jgi:toxin YoeB
MSYRLLFTTEAKEDLNYHIKSGDKATNKKLSNLFEELQHHPRIGTGKPEQLKYDYSGRWSRRINKEHRAVYDISDAERIVTIFMLWDHYKK